MKQDTTKTDRVNIATGVLAFLFMLVVGALLTQTTQASGVTTCSEFCIEDHGGEASANTLGQCLAENCRSIGVGIDLLLPHNKEIAGESLEKTLTGEQCVVACNDMLINKPPPQTLAGIDAIRFLTQCLGNCNPPSIDSHGSTPATLTNLISEYAVDFDEIASTRNAQSRGLCVLKSTLSKNEAEDLLVRKDVSIEKITNANIERVAPDVDQRNLLCSYSSIKLIMRYILFIVGVVTLLTTLLAVFLWITSRGESKKINIVRKFLWMKLNKQVEKRSVARKFLVIAAVGFIIVLLTQTTLGIIRSLL